MQLSRIQVHLLVLMLLMTGPAKAFSQSPSTVIPVNSPAIVYSPGNWAGDSGRSGSVYRQSWNSGAYFRFSWSTTSAQPSATLLFDTSILGPVTANPPQITYNVDGFWTSNIPIASSLELKGIAGPGKHILTVYIDNSAQQDRWGAAGAKTLNVVRLTGISVDSGTLPIIASPLPRWALIIGDSITEGIAANNGQSDTLADYSFFVGSGLQQLGYEYGVSACGFSGWLRPGDGTGDVPGYYVVSGSVGGNGGVYDDDHSRWNKINYETSLLDSIGHLSGYGGLHQEPSIILINYGTNDGLNHTSPSDTQASITRSITALRTAAPNAKIFLLVPFGQFDSDLLRAGLNAFRSKHPKDKDVYMIDLGKSASNGLNSNGYLGGLHPNMRGHAIFGSAVLAQIVAHLVTP